MKRILIDARMVTAIPHGIGVYVTDLASSLQQVDRKTYEPVYILPENRQIELSRTAPWSGVSRVFARSAFLHPSEWLELPRLLRREKAALYHSPSFASLPSCPVPWVQTVHDLNHLTYGSLFQKAYYRTLLRRSALGARALISISDAAKKELAAWLGDRAPKIETVFNAITDRRPELEALDRQVPEVLARFDVKAGSYLICVANPKPHKNLPLLVKAYGEARAREPGLARMPLLVTVSSADLRNAPPGVRAVGGLATPDILALIRGSSALVFPSLYEGFGRPPVEAVSLGAPVVVSDLPTHREGLRGVSHDCVRFLSPEKPEAWVEGLAALARRPLARPIAADLAWVAETFSLRRMGNEMDRIYRAVLGMGAE